jgi:hypothetical protein
MCGTRYLGWHDPWLLTPATQLRGPLIEQSALMPSDVPFGRQLLWLPQYEPAGHVGPVQVPDVAIAAVGAVIERITGKPTAKPAAVNDKRRNTTRRLTPERP